MFKWFRRRWIRKRRREAHGETAVIETEAIVLSDDARVSVSHDGAVFLNTRSGVVYTANRIGASIWTGLQNRESLESIVSRISGENQAQPELVRRDTADFITELETQGFLCRRMAG